MCSCFLLLHAFLPRLLYRFLHLFVSQKSADLFLPFQASNTTNNTANTANNSPTPSQAHSTTPSTPPHTTSSSPPPSKLHKFVSVDNRNGAFSRLFWLHQHLQLTLDHPATSLVIDSAVDFDAPTFETEFMKVCDGGRGGRSTKSQPYLVPLCLRHFLACSVCAFLFSCIPVSFFLFFFLKITNMYCNKN